jgi:hypothetical protein
MKIKEGFKEGRIWGQDPKVKEKEESCMMINILMRMVN